jgi:hypothetical protein
MIIDLEQDFSIGDVALSGFEKGHNLRVKHGLEQLDGGSEVVTVVFPHYVRTVSESFFRGLFLDSYKKLGKEAFGVRYKLDSESNLSQNLTACVEDLHGQTMLPEKQDNERESDWRW